MSLRVDPARFQEEKGHFERSAFEFNVDGATLIRHALRGEFRRGASEIPGLRHDGNWLPGASPFWVLCG